MYDYLEQNAVITGKSPSFLRSYGNSLARLALHYKLVPTEISTVDVNKYLQGILTNPKLPSETYFKFIIYSLRYIYKLYELEDKHVSLPSIKTKKRLPTILSREEIIRLLNATQFKKHRVLLLLLYGCGLRCTEARKLKINDIDFDRRTIHIRNGKGGKHRYVPLSLILMDEIVAFLADDHRSEYLLERSFQYKNREDESISSNTIGLTVRIAMKRANIKKRATAHTLRHTFATHLLEDGLDVVSIKELLGHERIETTMIYLHVAHYERSRAFSPLDTLYRTRIQFGNFPAFANQMQPMQKGMFLAEYN